MGEPVSYVDEFLWLIEQLETTLIWVPGNNDFGRAFHRMNARLKSIEGRILEFADRKFTGVGGSPASWAGQYQGERSVDRKAIAGTIFISHVPPPGIAHYEKFDFPVGDGLPLVPDAVARSLSRTDFEHAQKSHHKIKLADSPLIHVCGHLHHTWGVGHLGSTKVIKLAAAYLGYLAVLDLDDLTVKFDNIFK